MSVHLSNEEFNAKYKLNQNFSSKIHLAQDRNLTNNIAGKPKILAVEIIKRFFKNPVVVLATLAFLALILTSVIIYFTSPYLAAQRIDANSQEKLTFIKSLPPLFDAHEISFDTLKIKSYNVIVDSEYYQYLRDAGYGLSFNTEYSASGSQFIEYNAYDFYTTNRIFTTINQDHWNSLVSDSDKIAYLQELGQAVPKLKTYLGTTENGYDIWTTAWVGVIQSMKVALIVASIEFLIGVTIGAYLGFHAGKWIDTVVMRIIEIFQSPPSIIWLLMFVSIWGTNDWVLIGGLLFVGWTWPIGTTRMFIITVKDEEYITAAKSIGASTPRQVYLHALPAIIGKLAMNFVRRIPSVILSVASLAFLGFFKDDNSANIGKFMIDNISQSELNPWLMILPASILLVLSLSLQFIAVGVHDALDPKIVKAR